MSQHLDAPPAGAPTGPNAASGGSRTRLLVIALLVVAVGALALLLLWAFGPGGSASPGPSAVPAGQEASDDEAAEPGAATDADDADEATDVDEADDAEAAELVVAAERRKSNLVRDPFSEVVPVAETADADPDATDPDAPDPDAPDPGDDPDDPTAPAPEPPPTTGCELDEVMVCDGRLVALIEILRPADDLALAIVQVDTTVYEVVPGTWFADAFLLQSIEGSCATLQFHDGHVFELCATERELK